VRWRQQGWASDKIHDFGAILALVSTAIALEPGDVVITGSAAGFSPPRWRQPGDVVRVEVSGLGAIEQRIVS
jgi:2-keto-4-pentenoate hydratase/2-oxohepta-3-ene-1,7-dioic acid hydratase in catechol pathway